MKPKQSLNSLKLNFQADAKLLVAVSGGIDSMVLCDLLLRSRLNFSVAHCNFQLRGKESDEDEKFVQLYCSENKIPFFSKKFEIIKFKKSGNFSTQMAARALRYEWFEELISGKNEYLLTAHHLNDALETFLINLSRGSGLNGLMGINSDKIKRPLLSYSKAEILTYAENRNLKWREDSSNETSDYVRNKIRHKIFPVLEEIHPHFLDNFSKSIQFLNEENQMMQNHLENIKNQLFKKNNDVISISIAQLKKLNPIESYIHHLFMDFGFQKPKEILKLMDSVNGEIRSKSHRMIRNRAEILLAEINPSELEDEIQLNEDEILEKPLYLRFLKSEDQDFEANEVLDYEKIKFPLRLRKIKKGDHFFPFGMKGSKKLSKYFKDEKYSKLEKENTWLLVDDEDRIVYVVGKRIDDRFKITKHTHKYLNIYL